MFKLALKHAIAHRTRFIMTGLSVVLAVAFLTSTLVLSSSATGSALEDTENVSQNVDAAVQGLFISGLDGGPDELFSELRTTLPATTVDAVRSVDGVAAAQGVLSGFAKLIVDGAAVGVDAQDDVGRNWISDTGLNPFSIAAGQAPTGPYEVTLDVAIADEAGLSVGDTVQIITGTGVRDMLLVGLTSYGEADAKPMVKTVHFASDYAAEALGTDRLTTILLSAQDGVSQADLVDRVRPIAPEGEVIDQQTYIDQQQAAISEPLSYFSIMLLTFAAIAGVVAATIIFNTFAIAIAQRRRDMAILRAVGVERRQILGSLLVEAAIIGIVASAIGLILGVASVGLLRSGMAVLGASFGIGAIVIDPVRLMIAATLGVVVTVMSALGPARRAANASPIEALREAAVEPAGITRTRILAGSVLLALAAAGLMTAVVTDSAALLATATLAIPGLVLVGPGLVGLAAAAARGPMTRLGFEGMVASTNLDRNRRRGASTSLGLTLGVALLAFFTITAATFSHWLAGDLEEGLTADYVVTSVTFESATIDPQLSSSLARLPGVSAVSPLRVTIATVTEPSQDPTSETVGGVDPGSVSDLYDLGIVDGSVDRLASGGVAVQVSDESAIAVDDILTIQFVDTTITLPVVATFENNVGGGFEAPTYLVSLETLAVGQSGLADSFVFVGADNSAQGDLRDAVAGSPGALFETRRSYIDGASGEIEEIRNFVNAMVGLTAIMALVGVANTTTLAVRERTREIGTLRAIGATARSVRRIIRLEAGLLGLLGTAVGVGLALVTGWAVLSVFASAGATGLAVPWVTMIGIGAVASVASVAAAARPAWTASRMPALDALATDV